jgi:hypothetical protein
MTRHDTRPDRLMALVVVAALVAELAAIGLSTTAPGQTKGSTVAISLFVYWRVWRGGHLARGIALFLSMLGFGLFAGSLVSSGQVPWAWLQCLLYGAEMLLLLSPPLRRYIKDTWDQQDIGASAHTLAGS